MLVIWLVCAFLCLIGFIPRPKVAFAVGNKPITFKPLFGAGMFFLVVILMTANNKGYDADAYERFFNVVKATGVNPYDYTYEALYKLEQLFLRFFRNLTYQYFHALVLFITGALCIYPFLKKYSYDSIAVFSLYVLSGVFASDGMQFKNFIAVCFLILALYFYCDSDNNRNSIFFYYAFLTIAILFHFSFALYVFIPLTKMKWFERVRMFLPVWGGVLYILFLFGGNIISGIITFISKIRFLSKAAGYAISRAGIRSIVPVMIYYIILFTLYYCRKRIKYVQNNEFSVDEKTRNELAVKIRSIWELMGIFLVILGFANATYRLFRNLYIPVFTVVINAVLTIENRNRRIIGIMMTIMMAFIIFIYPILLGSYVDIYLQILEGEWFWNTQ